MAVLTDQQKAEMRAATRSAAFALSDDLKHIREIVSKEKPTSGDIRRLSTLLRRILLDGDLRTVAAPRIGRVKIPSPQLKAYHQHNEKKPIYIFFGGELEFPGGAIANLHLGMARLDMHHPKPDEKVLLNVEQFNAQRVICYKGRWVTRTSVIKYVVIAAHAAHSADPKKDPDYEFLEELKHRAAIQPSNGFPSLVVSDWVSESVSDKLRFDRDRIDLALAQLHSTAKYLVSAPDVQTLEELIDAEHGAL